MSSTPFQGKTAMITGAASGIGRATAIAFAAKGANVVVSDVDEAGGQETVSMIEAARGTASFVLADVSQEDQVDRLVAKTVETYGSLDFGVNNAGVGGSWGRVADVKTEDFRQVMAINVEGVFFCMRAELQQMLRQGSGSIINISSIAGLRGLANSSAYSASKHAVIGLTKTAALEYARKHIRINAICPVFTRSKMFDSMFAIDPSYKDNLVKNIPMRRYGQPEDIANGIVWLCSEESSFVTGQCIPFDGGLSAG